MRVEKMGRMKFPVGINWVGYFPKWVGYYPISDRCFKPWMSAIERCPLQSMYVIDCHYFGQKLWKSPEFVNTLKIQIMDVHFANCGKNKHHF